MTSEKMYLEKVLEGFDSEFSKVFDLASIGVSNFNIPRKIRDLYPDFHYVSNGCLLDLGIHKNYLHRMYNLGVFDCNVKKVRFRKRCYFLTKDIKSLVSQYVHNIKMKGGSPYKKELYRIWYGDSKYSSKKNNVLLSELAELKKDFNRRYFDACKANRDLVGSRNIIDCSINRSQVYILERYKEDRVVLSDSVLEGLVEGINDKVNRYIENSLRLVLYYFDEIYRKEETDDLFQEAYFIFRKAVINHDRARGKVATYFFTSLNRKIKSKEMQQRRLIRLPKTNFFSHLSEESVDEKFKTKIEGSIFYECGFNGMIDDERGLVVKNPKSSFNVYSARKQVDELLQKYFFERERKIFSLRMAGLPLNNIGDRFGLTRERIRQICDEVQERLTNHIQKGKVLKKL